jgi:hypothetical protein
MTTKLSPQHHDMFLLKWPILVLIFAVLASAIWCGSLYRFGKINQKALQTARANQIQTETSVRQIEEQMQTINSFIDRYRKLAADGVINVEDRLELVETIGRIRARYNLYPVQLDIEQQATVPLNQDGEDSGNATSLKVSRIQISIPLLHEEDLSHLLDGLQGMKRGIFVVETCSIKGSGHDHPELHENLTTFCKILWLTLKQGKGDGGQ